MRGEWEKVKDIVNKLDVSWDVVTDWFQLYNDEWFDWLCKMKYEWRRVSEFEQHKDIIIDLIKNNVYNSYTELYVAIKDSVWEIKVWVDALRKFCKKNEIWVIVKRLNNSEIHT
jgi:transposase